MGAKKKPAPAKPFPQDVMEAAHQIRSIRLARLPRSLKSDKGADIRKSVQAYMRERRANS
jgi:hypothetical protein